MSPAEDTFNGAKMYELIVSKMDKIGDDLGSLRDWVALKMDALSEKLDDSLVDVRKEVHALQIEESRRQVTCQARAEASKDLRSIVDKLSSESYAAAAKHASDMLALEKRILVLEDSVNRSDWKITMKTVAKFAGFIAAVSGAVTVLYQFFSK